LKALLLTVGDRRSQQMVLDTLVLKLPSKLQGDKTRRRRRRRRGGEERRRRQDHG